MRAEEDRPAPAGRLDDVVPAPVDQAAAAEQVVPAGVQVGQVAHGVDQHRGGGAVAGRQLRKAVEIDPGPAEQGGHRLHPFQVARGEHEDQRAAFGQPPIHGKELFLLALVGGAADKDRLVACAEPRPAEPPGRLRVVGGHVVFQVAAHPDARGVRAQGNKSPSIGLGDHRQAGEAAQQPGHGGTDVQVAAAGTLGEPAVDERHGHPCTAQASEHHRPEFGFQADIEVRPDRPQGPAHRRNYVERRHQAGDLRRQAALGQAMALLGGGGEHHPQARARPGQVVKEHQRGLDLAHRGGVQPEDALTGPGGHLRVAAQPLRQPVGPAAAQQLDQRPKERERQMEHRAHGAVQQKQHESLAPLIVRWRITHEKFVYIIGIGANRQLF